MGWEDKTVYINQIIKQGAESKMADLRFLELEIQKFKRSIIRRDMIIAERYYQNDHDILQRKRLVIGEDGELEEVKNLPNNKVVDNQYGKLVDQKANYLLAKPMTFDVANETYAKLLKTIFNKRFLRTFRNLGQDAINAGIVWLHPHYDCNGQFVFKKFEPYEILPFWIDAEHTVLDFAVRLYQAESYEGEIEKIIEKVEVYDQSGIQRYILQNGHLIPDVEKQSSTHFISVKDGKEIPLNWQRIPLIAFKSNAKEIPLIKRVKSLQDGINSILSDFQNNMQEDARNTIMILVNYDGADLGTFRHNLSKYGAVKVRNDGSGASGDVRTLEVTVNAENYKAILALFKKALIENGRGYDAKDDRMANNPNQMNIQSMYSDIDLDANNMETEFQASFEELLWFVNAHLANTGAGDFSNEEVTVVFNRDILINESESIENCAKSTGILSNETIVAQHPWTVDVKQEMERIKKEKQENQSEMDEYKQAFPGGVGDESK